MCHMYISSVCIRSPEECSCNIPGNEYSSAQRVIKTLIRRANAQFKRNGTSNLSYLLKMAKEKGMCPRSEAHVNS